MRITKRDKVHVPWLELARTPTKYLDSDTIPNGFKVLDPSKLTKDIIFDLWCHWSGWARAKLPILTFIKAREQDLGVRARNNFEQEKRVVEVLTRMRGHQGPLLGHPHTSVFVSLNSQLSLKNRVLQQITATGQSSYTACPLTPSTRLY